MGRRLVPLFGAAGVLVTFSFLRLRFSAEEAVARSNDVPAPSLSVPDAEQLSTSIQSTEGGGTTPPTMLRWVGPSAAVAASPATTSTTSTVVTPKPVDTRRYDFVFCANIIGTLGNALQALKAFLIIAKRVQDRGWRVLVQLPALGLREMDWAALEDDENGTALGEVLELTELRKLFEIDEASDAVAASRVAGCWAQGCDVSIWSLAQVHSLWLSEVEVPHLWLGPGKEKWMFEQLFDNLGALSNNRPITGLHAEERLGTPLRIFWEMQRYSPSRCAPWVYGYLERQIASALVVRAEEPEPCAFVYVGHIIHREGWWKLKSFNRWAFAHPDRLRADIPTVAGKIGQLLQEYQISCANFYVKLLGLTGQNFVDLVHQGAERHGVNFTAKRVKKAMLGLGKCGRTVSFACKDCCGLVGSVGVHQGLVVAILAIVVVVIIHHPKCQEVRDWTATLSAGERQRLAFARLFMMLALRSRCEERRRPQKNISLDTHKAQSTTALSRMAGLGGSGHHPTPRFGRSLGNDLWKAGQKELTAPELGRLSRLGDLQQASALCGELPNTGVITVVDEGTSAVEMSVEAALYGELRKELQRGWQWHPQLDPNVFVASTCKRCMHDACVSHRPSLQQYHDTELVIGDEARIRTEPILEEGVWNTPLGKETIWKHFDLRPPSPTKKSVLQDTDS
eukprot:s2442_g9.t1